MSAATTRPCRRLALELDLPVPAAERDCLGRFHSWIREGGHPAQAVDVASYAHVPDGPGVLLIGHGFQLSYRAHGSGGRLRYDRHQPRPRGLAELAALVMSEGLAYAERMLGGAGNASIAQLQLIAVDRSLDRDAIDLDVIDRACAEALGAKRATLVALEGDDREAPRVRIILRSPIALGVGASAAPTP